MLARLQNKCHTVFFEIYPLFWPVSLLTPQEEKVTTSNSWINVSEDKKARNL